MEYARPWLDPESVQTALEHISRSEPFDRQHPLFAFLLVRDHLAKPEQLSGDYGVLVGISEVFERCFVDVLGEDRREVHDPRQTISQDFNGEDYRRELYSFLYYRYMRSDFGLSLDEIIRSANLGDRTLRRRQADGLNALTHDLVQREVRLRRLHVERVLQSRIPYPDNRSLYGREQLVQAAVNALLEQIPVLLVGLPGIGKTSVAAAIAHQMIPHIGDLYWVNLHEKADVYTQLMETVTEPSVEWTTPLDVVSILSARTGMVVFESLGDRHFKVAKEQLTPQLRWLCTTMRFPKDWHGLVLDVPPMERDLARRFFEAIRGNLAVSQFDKVYDQSSGVPGSMIEFVHAHHLSTHEADHLSLNHYFGSIWQQSNDAQRQIWALTYLLGEISELEIGTLPLAADEECLLDLISAHVLKPIHDVNAYQLTFSSKSYVENDPSGDVQQTIVSIVEMLWEQSRYDVLLKLFVNGVSAYLPISLCESLLADFARNISYLGLWGQWVTLLDRVEPELTPSPYWSLWLRLERIRCERWQGFYVDGYRKLQSLIDEAGQRGHFDLYGRGLVELASIALYQQRWDVAVAAAEDGERALARVSEDDWMAARFILAKATLHNDPTKAIHLLQEWFATSATALSIASEASLRLGDYAQAIAYAEQSLTLTSLHTPNYGRALSALALALYHDEKYLVALDTQQQSINTLSLTPDLVGLARAYNNLGTIYYTIEKYELATQFWEQSRDIFLKIQDAVGLQTVLANLELVPDSRTSSPKLF